MLYTAQLTQLVLAPLLLLAAGILLLAAMEAPSRRARGYRRFRRQALRLICLMLAGGCLSGVFDLAAQVERAARKTTPAPEIPARSILAYR